MIAIRFSGSADRLLGFVCQGHSGYAEAGEDIVCAAVTSAIRLAECTIDDVYGAGADVQVDEKTALISLTLPEPCPNGAACQAVLRGLLLYLRQLRDEYPAYLSILEV